MTKRWFIYKEDQPSGPYTAAEIRQLLRDGSVDPFDFVSQEGSQFKQELVEVDEIFSSDNIAYEEPEAAAVGDGKGFAPQIAERSYSNKDKQIAPNDNRSPKSQAPGQVIALASDIRKLGKSENLPVPVARALPVAKKRKRDPKKYHLIDPKGRVLGPLSPGEIQSLYYRGVVDKNVKVMRDGSSSVVPVGKFVSAYAQAQGLTKVPKQGAHPQIHGISKSALNRMALMRRAEEVRTVAGMAPITVGILGVAALLLIITVILIIKDGTLFKGAGSKPKPRRDVPARVIQQPRQQKPKKVKAIKKKTTKKKRPSYLNPIYSPSNGGKLSKPNRRPKQAKKVKPVFRTVRTKPKPAVAYTPTLKRRVQPFYTKPKPKPVYRPPPVVQKPKYQASATSVKPVVKPAGKPVAKPTGPNIAGLVDGQSISGFGPLSFSRDAVKSCEGACTVTFYGGGGSVSVAFFKNVWGSALLAKSGGVYISGLVRKSGGSTKILLSGVK